MQPLERFTQYLASERLSSPHTCTAYLQDAQKLLVLAKGQALSTLTPQDIRGFIRKMASEGLSARSIARLLSVWRSWYKLLIRDAGYVHNPCLGIKAPKMQKKLPATLPVDVVQYFLDTLPEDTFLSLRDKAIFELAYSSGLRVSELANLTLLNLNLAEGTLTITGKGNKTRVVPFGKTSEQVLNSWLSIRTQRAKEQVFHVFINQHGKKMSTRNIALRLKAWGIKLGVSTPLHPHMMRHSCASHLLQSSQDLRAVQEMLGHASIQTTQIYTHLDYQHLAKIYDAAHPRAKQEITPPKQKV